MSDEKRLAELCSTWEAAYSRGKERSAEDICSEYDCPHLAERLESAIEQIKQEHSGDQTDLHFTPPEPGGSIPIPDWLESAPNAGDSQTALPIDDFSELRYKPVRFHAKGGLGEVFVARDEEVSREVALKRIQPKEADWEENRLRFLREAEITGRLEHPGVVPIYGMGVASSGQPYYAMRFIRGESFHEAAHKYHRQRSSPETANAAHQHLRKLLQNFVAVCNTIAYAHSRGVIHRDIKPANIMLGKYGETLVVDWGLAKYGSREEHHRKGSEEESLHPTRKKSAEATELGMAMGTPAYMSPEQATGQWPKVGPAADIFSLGATLYHLLVGRPPYQGENALWACREWDFPAPREIRADIPKPLSAICLQAMAKQPKDRYKTALNMAQDVEQWLADEPVSAWQEPWYIKTRRWLNRRRTLVASVFVGLCVTVIGFLLATVFLSAANERERLARQAADDQKQEAQQQTEKAKANLTLANANQRKAEQNFKTAKAAVDRYFVSVSQERLFHRPDLSPLRKELLKEARNFYEKFVQENPERSDLQMDLGKAYYRLGFIEGQTGSHLKAVALLDKAIVIYKRQIQFDDQNILAYKELGECYYRLASFYFLINENASAKKFYQRYITTNKVIIKAEPNNPDHISTLAWAYNDLGLLHLNRHEYIKAYDTISKATTLFRSIKAKHPDNLYFQSSLAINISNAGLALAGQGMLTKALTFYHDALAIQKHVHTKAPLVGQYRNYLANIYFGLGEAHFKLNQLEKAEEYFLACKEHRDTLVRGFPYQHYYQERLGWVHARMADMAKDIGNNKSRLIHCQECMKIWGRLKEEQPNMLRYRYYDSLSHSKLAQYYQATGDNAKAEKQHQQALDILKSLPKKYQQQSSVRALYADIYHSMAVDNITQRKFRNVVHQLEKAVGYGKDLAHEYPQNAKFLYDLSKSYQTLAEAYRISGEYEKAEEFYNTCIKLRTTLVEQFPEIIDYQYRLSSGLRRLGFHFQMNRDYENALKYYRKCNAALLNITANHGHVSLYLNALAESYNRLGNVYFAQENYQFAGHEYNQAIHAMLKIKKQHPDNLILMGNLVGCHRRLGNCLFYQNKYKDAETVLGDSIAMMEALLAKKKYAVTLDIQRSHLWFYADTLCRLEKYEKSLKQYERVFATINQPTTLLKLGQAVAVAGTGKYQKAINIADAIDWQKKQTDAIYYEAAMVFGLAYAKIINDDKLSPKKKHYLSVYCREKCLLLLQRTADLDYFRHPDRRSMIKTDARLQSLIPQTVFQDFIQHLKK